jgi:putative FmdB family regulatory protein
MSPLYVFHCLDCGHRGDYYFKNRDVTGWKCEKCGGTRGEKIPALSSFRLHNTTPGGFTNTSSKS